MASKIIPFEEDSTLTIDGKTDDETSYSDTDSLKYGDILFQHQRKLQHKAVSTLLGSDMKFNEVVLHPTKSFLFIQKILSKRFSKILFNVINIVFLVIWIHPGNSVYSSLYQAILDERKAVSVGLGTGFVAFAIFAYLSNIVSGPNGSVNAAFMKKIGDGKLVSKKAARYQRYMTRFYSGIITFLVILTIGINIPGVYSNFISEDLNYESMISPIYSVDTTEGLFQFIGNCLFFCVIIITGCHMFVILTQIHFASTIIQDLILEILVNIEQLPRPTKKNDDKSTVLWNRLWTKNIVIPSIALIKEHVPELSRGFQLDLVLMTLGSWLFAISLFAYAQDMNFMTRITRVVCMGYCKGSAEDASGVENAAVFSKIVILFTSYMFAFLPFGLFWCFASVSSYCEELMDALNELRYRDLRNHEKIIPLELAMHQLHRGAGLGFTLYGTVIDKPTLSTFFAKLASIMFIVLPLVQTFFVVPFESQMKNLCKLSEKEQLGLRQCGQMMGIFDRSGVSCVYNTTIGSDSMTLW